MRHVREHFGDDVEPGDVFLANDPYGFGGQHLPDLYVIQPIFHEDELEGYAATMAHHVDVGGIAPGSVAVHATEIFQEGLRMPLLKLFEAGRENTSVMRIIENNTRQPVEVIGDLRAQLSACRSGARGLVGILERYGTLAQLVPERVVAPGEGGPSLIAIGGYHRGKPFVLAEVIVGSWGARASRDGTEGMSNPLANLSNQPVELVESDLPLRIHEYGLVPDSGGPGKFRGGLAYGRSYELRADEAVLTVRSDRRSHPPYGIEGGEAGAPSSNVIRSGGADTSVPTMPMEALNLRRGDVFRHVCAGGGGSGSPLERDPALVLEDVLDGKVTPGAARARYGVVIANDGTSIDQAATAAARAAPGA